MEQKTRPRRVSCLISLADSTILEIDIDWHSSVGQDIVNRVCEHLGIIESEYFGLLHQPCIKSAEQLWLNLRNPVHRQLCGSAPYRLQFRVKFFVPPHLIQQQATRHQFYVNIRESLRNGYLRPETSSQTVSISALLAQLDAGDADKVDPACARKIYSKLVEKMYSSNYQCEGFDACSEVSKAHLTLKGTTCDAAKYQLIQAVSELSTFGLHCYQATVTTTLCSRRIVNIAICSGGIIIFDNCWKQLDRISFVSIQKLTHDGQNVIVQSTDDHANISVCHMKLTSRLIASALYRDMTEMYYFYRCDTVSSEVLTQYCRDLKGIVASVFNENTDIGKSYMFDLVRTANEAYDRIRRILHDPNSKPMAENCMQSPAVDTVTKSSETTAYAIGREDSCQQHCSCCQALQTELHQLRDRQQCSVCCASPINVAFVPCGHTVCCVSCSKRLERCPICNVTITLHLKVYLPSAD